MWSRMKEWSPNDWFAERASASKGKFFLCLRVTRVYYIPACKNYVKVASI